MDNSTERFYEILEQLKTSTDKTENLKKYELTELANNIINDINISEEKIFYDMFLTLDKNSNFDLYTVRSMIDEKIQSLRYEYVLNIVELKKVINDIKYNYKDNNKFITCNSLEDLFKDLDMKKKDIDLLILKGSNILNNIKNKYLPALNIVDKLISHIEDNIDKDEDNEDNSPIDDYSTYEFAISLFDKGYTMEDLYNILDEKQYKAIKKLFS